MPSRRHSPSSSHVPPRGQSSLRPSDSEADTPVARVKAGLDLTHEAGTVQEHLEDWLRAKKGQVRSGTYLKYESHLKTHVIPAFGSLRLQDLDYRRRRQAEEQST